MDIQTNPKILEHDLYQLRVKQSQLDIFLPKLMEEFNKLKTENNNLRSEIDQIKAEIREIKARR